MPDRGTMMGNRGIIHDPGTRQLLNKRWQHKAWICCVLSFKDFQHPIMGVGRYTELFFLDEATAFAAGHRPCAYCRRGDFVLFKEAWVRAHGGQVKTLYAPAIDARLHLERTRRDRSKVTFEAQLDDLPDGVFVRIGDKAWVTLGDSLLEWTPSGYTNAQAKNNDRVDVLTPRAVVDVFSNGYRAALHASARGVAPR